MALRARLRELSPKLFGDGPPGSSPLPLMRGIDRVLIERLGLVDAEDLRLLKVTMRTHVRRKSYLLALAAEGAQRHNLAGEPVEFVSDEHRDGARAWLAKLAEKPVRKVPAKPQGDRINLEVLRLPSDSDAEPWSQEKQAAQAERENAEGGRLGDRRRRIRRVPSWLPAG